MPKHPILRFATWLTAAFVCFGLLFEVGVRIFWTSLPNILRTAIVGVRVVPWSEETLDLQKARFKLQEAESQPEAPDVLILGDSFTFCWMDSDECLVAHLNAHGWRALSAAVLGSGSTAQLGVLRNLLPSLRMRLVIWQWYYNDADDNCRFEQRAAIIQALAETSERPPVVGSGIGQYSALARMLGNWLRWRAFAPPQPPPDAFARSSELPCESDMASVLNDYDVGIALAAEQGVTVIIALVPYIDEIEGAQGADSPLEEASQLRQALLAHCAARRYHCVDPSEAFRAAHQRGQLIYDRADLHLNVYGNRLFAEALIAYIERHQLLPTP